MIRPKGKSMKDYRDYDDYLTSKGWVKALNGVDYVKGKPVNFKQHFLNGDFEALKRMAGDPVNPVHYGGIIQCIEFSRNLNFSRGNAFKYLWRAEMKGGSEDIKKAIWYLDDEIENHKWWSTLYRKITGRKVTVLMNELDFDEGKMQSLHTIYFGGKKKLNKLIEQLENGLDNK